MRAAYGTAAGIVGIGTNLVLFAVKLVIGIAGAGDEHIDILSNIAVTCSDEDEVDEILKSSVDQIYDTFANIEAE